MFRMNQQQKTTFNFLYFKKYFNWLLKCFYETMLPITAYLGHQGYPSLELFFCVLRLDSSRIEAFEVS